MKKLLVVCMAVSAAAAFADTPKFEDFKVSLTGVAVMPANADDVKGAKVLPPQTRIVVTPGNVAWFYLEYSFPTNVESKIQLAPNYGEAFRDGLPCCFSVPHFVSGTGTSMRCMFVRGARRNKPYKEAVLLKSVRISGELEAVSGAPRNNEFVICDETVNVLFANETDSDGKGAVVLTPKPTPAPDPKLGVVPFDKNAKPVSSTPAGFTDNLDEALAKAKAEGKLVYACFCGSDWCGPCKRLDSEVFAKPEFVQAVENDYVLVFIDHPQNRGLLSARAKKENPKLMEKYGIAGVPHALILDGDGNKVGETGYRRGGAKAYAEHLLDIKRKR